MGQKIERPVRSPSPVPLSPVAAPKRIPSEDSGSPPPSSPDVPPSPVRLPTPPIEEKPKKKKRPVGEKDGKVKKGKGKKKDDMDDIFGF
jgi:hypothetical protein